MTNDKYVILQEGKDATVLYPYKNVYRRMVTFHADAWDDTVAAAEDYINLRVMRAKEISENFWSSVEIVGKIENLGEK